jgi:hypothetical protein
MNATDHDIQQKRILFGALQRLLEVGGKYLTISPDRIDVVDRFQRVHPVQIGNQNINADLDAIYALIRQNHDWSGNGSHTLDKTPFILGSSTWDTSSFGSFNEWSLITKDSSPDEIVIAPRKRLPMALDQVFSTDHDNLTRLRSLYREGGFSIGVFCRGETRADAVIAALTAERNHVNLPSNTAYFRDSRRSYKTYGAIDSSNVDNVPYVEGATWLISGCDKRAIVSKLIPGPDDRTLQPSARVFVGAHTGNGYLPARKSIEQHINAKDHPPALIITVDLTSNGPVAEFTFSKRLLAMTNTSHGFQNAPWDVIGEQKAKRDAVPKAPKTWHSTTEDVAKSFVARNAPRGYCSSKTIFFHGPIAYSIVDRNPIAAILDTPAGKPFILMGRSIAFGGTKAGTVSGAMGDISTAAGSEFQILQVGDLTEVLRYAGQPLETLPGHFRKAKNEDSFPDSASLHRTAFAKWLKNEYKAREDVLDKALLTPFATGVKAHAYRALADLSAIRDTVSDAYGIALPELGNPKALRAAAVKEAKAAEERQRELRDRRRNAP